MIRIQAALLTSALVLGFAPLVPCQAVAARPGAPVDSGGSASPSESESVEPEEPAEPEIVVAARELEADLDRKREKLAKLQAETRLASGDTRIALERQIEDLRVDALEVVSRLVANVLEQEVEGLQPTELRALEAELARESEWAQVIYTAWADNVEAMEALGMDAADLRADLITAVEGSAAKIAGRLRLDDHLGG